MQIDFLSEIGTALRVLVVDDNPESAKIMGWAIESWGHDVRMEYNGKDALRSAQEFLPQVIMLDIGMPDMNGYELCQILRQGEGLQKTIFIAQTGWGLDQHKEMSREAGFDHYLVKPIDLPALQRLLTAVTAGKIAN